MDDRDMRQTIQFLCGSNADEKLISRIKKDIEDNNLTDKINEMETRYAPLIDEYLKRIENKDIGKDEKAKILLELKKRLDPSDQKQFENMMKLLKMYLSKIINEK